MEIEVLGKNNDKKVKSLSEILQLKQSQRKIFNKKRRNISDIYHTM